MIEIERKFLLNDDFKHEHLVSIKNISQFYLCSNADKSVRIRIQNQDAFITIKGASAGISRLEYEYKIDYLDAKEMMSLCVGSVITKTRYIINANSKNNDNHNLFWEIDVFHDDNYGLIIAEIELPSEDYEFIKPSWLGEEVSHDSKYFNSNLSVYPYRYWR